MVFQFSDQLDHSHNWSKCLNKYNFNPLFHNVENWPNILLKSCGVNTARFFKYVWSLFNIMKQRVNVHYKSVKVSFERIPIFAKFPNLYAGLGYEFASDKI